MRRQAGGPSARARLLGLVAVASFAALVGACSSTTGQEVRGDADRLPSDPADGRVAAAATTTFAVSVEQALVRSEPQSNVVVAPMPLAVALTQVERGAGGAAADQLRAAFGGVDVEALAGGLDTVDQLLADRSGDQEDTVTGRQGAVSVEIPAATWAQRGTRFDPDWLDWLDARFGTGVRVVDFRSDPETARRSVNTWFEDQTNGHIDRLLERGEVTDRTRLLAASAGYLKAPWALPFPTGRTTLAPFTRLDGSVEDVPTLVAVDADLRVADGDTWQAVEIPYLGDALSMVVVVPDPGRFADVEASLDEPALADLLDELAPASVDLQLPEFAFTTELDLEQALRSIGVTAVFEPDGDLTGITGDEDLVLGGVPHHAYLSIDEEGTEAAGTAPRPEPTTRPSTTEGTAPAGAGTTIVPGDATSADADGELAAGATDDGVVLTVDRPFLVLVRDRATGAPLFYGRVVSPQG